MIGIPLGLATANAVEWVVHKHVLHGWGRRRGTFWSFHFHEHHRLVRDNDYHDPNYCLLYTSPSPRDRTRSRMPSSA